MLKKKCGGEGELKPVKNSGYTLEV